MLQNKNNKNTVSQSLSNIRDAKNMLGNIETVSKKNEEKFRQWNQTMALSLQELRDKIARARHIAEGVRFSFCFFLNFSFRFSFSDYFLTFFSRNSLFIVHSLYFFLFYSAAFSFCSLVVACSSSFAHFVPIILVCRFKYRWRRKHQNVFVHLFRRHLV